MRFGTWPCPRVEVIARRFRSELGDEIVGGLAKTPICRERDGLEVDVKPFVLDDFVGRAALVVGVDVGGVTTGSLTRRVVDVSVDGGVRDAGVQDRLAVVEEAHRRQVAFAHALVVVVVEPPELGDLGCANVNVSCLDDWPQSTLLYFVMPSQSESERAPLIVFAKAIDRLGATSSAGP